MPIVEKNQTYTGRVVDLTHEGHGVVKVDRYPIFVPQALTDETIRYKVIKVNKNFGFGKLIDVVEESTNRVTPPCDYYQKCGGCQLQHLSYEAQLDMKREQVVNLFHRKGKMPDVPIHPTVGMSDPWHYRNKTQIPVGTAQDGTTQMGFYRQRSHDIIDMDTCLIQDEIQNQIMREIKQLVQQFGITTYNEQKHQGLLRHVVIRIGHFTNEVMVILVVNGKKLPQSQAIVDALTRKFPMITSVKMNRHQAKSNVIMGPTSYTLYGKDYIEDTLNDINFEISDLSFYQINVIQTQKLYQIAVDYAQLTGNEVVLDAYCGIGTIALSMADKAKHVYGVEVVPEAIEDAKRNAKHNGYDNTTFVAGPAESVILDWQRTGIQPDVVTVDPPRKGCDPTFIETLKALAPERIVYVSCNPSTQLRDVDLLKDQYDVIEITPVDMFPHTTHVETVALLERR
ncbi:RNA methyltransferase [Staphylococcus microti]|uniref:RNA methyltransferase n=1 Tax=Staphylococcus microti TaxID=569857 RepID=A0A0D6XNU4_9STAP|nr:23S rRNA (uracil(1939)-C(5))-methyltransferase RlmD [Staphylococcus microti]KIX90464.1 RNA methyltransferase [Staphylococcus microti]PNZ83368.1 23S rRNA (uracil(1939)-C(5))-methyltransferase RlmD [Staphylococcus microti]SUM57921.1 TrmA family RNA methyltransferase [Staphylococcus microti]